MNIGEAAQRCGLSAKTVRYYEEVGLVTPGRQSGNAYRDYTAQDVEHLRFLHHARAVGFGLDECRLLLDLYRDPSRKSVQVKQLVLDKIADLDQRMASLNAMRQSLSDMANACAGDTTSQCAIIDKLATPTPPMAFTLVESPRK